MKRKVVRSDALAIERCMGRERNLAGKKWLLYVFLWSGYLRIRITN